MLSYIYGGGPVIPSKISLKEKTCDNKKLDNNDESGELSDDEDDEISKHKNMMLKGNLIMNKQNFPS